jgi:hypothetical protein
MTKSKHFNRVNMKWKDYLAVKNYAVCACMSVLRGDKVDVPESSGTIHSIRK